MGIAYVSGKSSMRPDTPIALSVDQVVGLNPLPSQMGDESVHDCFAAVTLTRIASDTSEYVWPNVG